MRIGALIVALWLAWPSNTIAQWKNPRRSIPDLVAEQGQVNMTIIPETPPMDLGTILDTAPLVARVRIVSVESQLTPNQMEIMTIAKGQVQMIFSNTLGRPVNPVLKVQFAGGKLSFPNGTAEYHNTDYPRLPVVGDEYIVLLKVDRLDQTRFTPVSSDGLFRIVAGRVVPDMPEHRPLFLEWQKKDVDELIAAIQGELRKKGR